MLSLFKWDVSLCLFAFRIAPLMIVVEYLCHQKKVLNHTVLSLVAKYETIEQVQQALRIAGLESSNLIIGIDFTKSNIFSGARTFDGRSLHQIGGITDEGSSLPLNPYQRVISILGRTLEIFDDDSLIPVYGFGDVITKNKSVFPFFAPDRPCHTFREVLARYSQIAPHIKLSGPTNFAPLINKAISIVKESEGLPRY